MSRSIAGEIARFDRYAGLKNGPGFTSEIIGDQAILIRPANPAVKNAQWKEKDIALTLMGITHGNEWAGLAVLNDLLGYIHTGTLNPCIPLAFVLGNPKAAKQEKRFLERDLNRSFSRPAPASFEEDRARNLEAILSRTAWLVDYHQTALATEWPFFIFPYTFDAYAFARGINPRQAIVTHWEAFSREGMCTDEFVNQCGGTGLTIETGRNGFDPYQIALGVDAGLRAIAVVSANLNAAPAADDKTLPASEKGTLYTWGDTVYWPEDDNGPRDDVAMDPGWINFKDVKKGQQLALAGGKPIKASVSGKILFPKYTLPASRPPGEMPVPIEMCRILKSISEKDLPGK